VTNVAAVLGAISAVISFGRLSSLISGVNPDAFPMLGLLFAAVAVSAPVLYGALAPGQTTANPVGTVGGVYLAAVATLTAAFGEISEVGLIASYSGANGGEKAILYIGLVVAAGGLAAYSYKSLDAMITPAVAKGAAPAAMATASLLNATTVVSATL
jgi:hypothetical protein